MRVSAFLFGVTLLVSGCATAPATGVGGAASNTALVKSLYEAFGRGDVPVVMAAMDQELVWNEAEGNPYADRNPYRGGQFVAENLFQRLVAEWNEFRVNPVEFIDGGDTVVVLGRYAGTYKSTSRALDAPFAHVWKLRNGRIVGFQQYTDTAQHQRVMTP